ncbi:MAG: hypothetical protein M0P64_03270 [Candidatus Pacebacteria bacterium]|jgi:hypothetical protein|nr:hypothetical protein [Candidatus Paceibacterota bacterium]
MFFRIFIVFAILLFVFSGVNLVTDEDEPPISFKQEIVQVAPRQNELAKVKDECKSFMATRSGKVCVSSGVSPQNEKDLPANSSTAGIVPSGSEPLLQGSSENPTIDSTSFKEGVEPETITERENPKIEPGTIFIPFYYKNCGLFCKQ